MLWCVLCCAVLCCAGAGAAGSWAQEFADNEGDFADWDSIFARNAAAGVGAAAAAADGEYVFSDHNPFLGDAAAFDKGKDLFKRGLLSEAALALEAEVGLRVWGFWGLWFGEWARGWVCGCRRRGC